MASKVGAKGNIVIEKEIRDRLGVETGWEAVQILSGDHVEVYFLPPVQSGDSFGMLHREGDRPLQGEGQSWADVVRSAWSTELAARDPNPNEGDNR